MKPPAFQVAIYARVSTEDQNCDLQLRDLRRYCRSRGWKLAGEYVDTGWSGAKVRRPELDRLMLDARARRIDCIIVWKLDRWGRTLSHCLESIQELRGLGVRWIATTQNLDTDESNPMQKAMLGMMAVFAEFEREMIRERVKAGMLAAKHRGKKLGRRRVVFDRLKARDMREKGGTIRAIASKFEVSIGTIHSLFKNGTGLALHK